MIIHIDSPTTMATVSGEAAKIESVATVKKWGKSSSREHSKREQKKQRNENRKQTKIILESRNKAAATAHIVQTDNAKRPKNKQRIRNLAQNNLKQKQESIKTADVINKPVSKKNSFDWRNRAKAMTKSRIGKFFTGKKGLLITAATLAGVGMLSAYGAKGTSGPGFVNTPKLGGFDSRNSYIPGSYQRGYHDIKEALTDFGSRVHLDRTIKSLVKPFSSTRHNVTRTVNTVYNDNIALSMHKNAINHTRY